MGNGRPGRALGKRARPSLVWCDPPTTFDPEPEFDHDALAAALRLRPGQWALVRNFPNTAGTGIMNGALRAYRPGGQFETFTRRGRLWVRYVGDQP